MKKTYISSSFKVLVLASLFSRAAVLQAQEDRSDTIIHGYVTTDYQGGVLVNDVSGRNKIVPNFEQLRFVFGFQGALSEHWAFNSEVELEHATRTGVKTTTSGGNVTAASAGLEIEVEQAWIENHRFDFFHPRMGVVLVPLGQMNAHHDSDTVASVDRPLLNQLIIPTTWYEPGVGFTGTTEMGIVALNYEAYLINGLRGTTVTAGDESKFRDLRMSKDAINDNNTDKAMVGRLGLGLGTSLGLGLSGYRGSYDPSSSLYLNMVAVDGTWRWKWMEFEGEWASLHVEKAQGTNGIFAGLRQGWYLQALANYQIGNFGLFQPWLQVGQIDTNVSEATVLDQVRYTLGLNYRPAEKVVFKLAYADTQYFQSYVNAAGGQSAILDQRLMAAAAWGF